MEKPRGWDSSEGDGGCAGGRRRSGESTWEIRETESVRFTAEDSASLTGK